MTNSGGNSAAIYRDGNLAISLEGEKSTVTGSNEASARYGIYADSIIISGGNGASLEVTGESYGIYAEEGSITIKGGTVTATGTGTGTNGNGYGIRSNGGTVTISGGIVEATGSTQALNAGTGQSPSPPRRIPPSR